MGNQTNKLNLDYTLISIIILLGCVSIFSLYTIEPTLPEKFNGFNFPLKQTLWYIAGGIVIYVTMLIDYDRFRQITWVLYGAGLTSLLMLFLRFPPGLVHEANNAVSWFKFPGIGTVQPAEFMKVILVLTIAHVMVQHNEKYINKTIKSDLGLLGKILLLVLPPMGLIAIQPDLGTFLVIAAITACMILISGIQWRIIVTILLAGIGVIASAITLWYFFPESIGAFLEESIFRHVSSRFVGWLNPEQNFDAGFQLIRAMMAIGSGQLLGKGIGDMEVYIPERHTDMIFTAISEQFGFIGASLVVTLFFLLIYRLIHIALMSNDKYGSYLVTGLIGMFTYQIFQNIGMSIQLLPITGLPLPFLSYGGSSTLTYLLAIGVVLNVHSRTRKYMFE